MYRRFLLDSLHRSWAQLPVSYRGAIVIAIPAICLIATLIAWVWSRQVSLALNQQIDFIQATLAKSDELLIALLNAETGVRGYTISQDRQLLKPYYQARANLPRALARLNQALLVEPQQAKRFQQIEQLVQQRMNLLDQRIELYANRFFTHQSLQDLRLFYRGKALMDELRDLLRVVNTHEQQRLNLKRQGLKAVQEIITSIQWLAAFVSVMAYLVAIHLFYRLDRDLEAGELQLHQSRAFIEAMTANVVDGVITLTREGKIETFNPAAARLFGYQPEEVIGQNLVVLLENPQDWNRVLTERDSKLRGPLAYSPWQTQGHRKVGAPFPIELSISELGFDERSIVIIRDVTERQQAQANLQARAHELARLSTVLATTNTALEKQNQELEKFASVVAHDLKAPLRAIANLSEWIEEDLQGQLPAESRHQMQLLRRRVYRMEALINGLLEYSRISHVQAKIESVDVEALLVAIINSLDPQSIFTIEINAGMPIFRTKRVFLEQVFIHLLSNAIKHHDCSKGRILISVIECEKFYEFSVTDDGPGIASEYHDKIFVIFQTLLPRDQQENIGVGLAIAKKIVEGEGGKIGVESQEGAGSTFYFTWPKQVSEAKGLTESVAT